MENIYFEPLKEVHFELILRWFNKSHVQAFYSLRNWTYEEVYKKLQPYVRGEAQINCFVVYLENHPIGYIQSYSLKDHPWENQDLSEEIVQEAAGFDLFIGEENISKKEWVAKSLNVFLKNAFGLTINIVLLIRILEMKLPYEYFRNADLLSINQFIAKMP